MDMQKDVMAEQGYGKVALQKMAPTPENFRLYEAEWLGKKPSEFTVMKVTGAEFREAKTGPNKGKLSVIVKDSKRVVYVTREEMNAFDAAANN
jgi:hypothetical protein